MTHKTYIATMEVNKDIYLATCDSLNELCQKLSKLIVELENIPKGNNINFYSPEITYDVLNEEYKFSILFNPIK